MNFELLTKLIFLKMNKEKNTIKKKNLFNFWIYNYKLLLYKKNKLKLGLIGFEIKKIERDEIVFIEYIEIRHLKQDNTQEDEQKLENILKRFSWKNDFDHFFAFSLIFLFIFKTIKKPIVAYKDFFYDTIFGTPTYFYQFSNYFFKIIFTPFTLKNQDHLFTIKDLNLALVDLIVNFIVNYNLIF